MFRSRNFPSERNILHIKSYKSRLLDYASRTDEPHVARGHSNATLTLPDAITRGETWRTSECTQCLPYWLACSVLRNVINTSLTHAPNPAVPRNVQPFNFYSAATALPSSLLIFLPSPREFARIRVLSQRETRGRTIRQIGRKERQGKRVCAMRTYVCVSRSEWGWMHKRIRRDA